MPRLRITCHSDVKIFEKMPLKLRTYKLTYPGAMSTKRL